MIRSVAALCVLATTATAEIRFENHSANLPPHQYSGGWEHFVGGGVAVFDCDGDHDPDIYVAGGENAEVSLRNLGAMRFEKIDNPVLGRVTGAYPIDIDGDAILDLFVLRVGPNAILRGQGDCRFEVAEGAWAAPALDQWSTAFSAWWRDDDTPPVMAVGNYVDRADPEGPFEACDDNVILSHSENGFQPSPLSPGYCALSMLAGTDARGAPTLRISNDRHYYVRGGSEQMWDITEERFLTAEDGWPEVSLWGMGIGSHDLTGDGRDEVMLTSMGDQLLQIAQADGTYAAAPFEIGTYAHRPHVGDDGRPSTGWHAEFGDVDNDGRADLFIAKGNVDQMPGMAMRDPNNLLRQRSDGGFDEVSVAAGIATTERSRGGALADFDGDGRLDLIVVNRRADLELYRNVTADTGAWIAVALTQEGANSQAVGARVTVNGQTREMRVGGGHAGGQALPLHFGLGDATQATITVTWPDDSQSSLSAEVNQRVALHKP